MPEPWPAILVDHRDALRQLLQEIERTAAENQRLLELGATTDVAEGPA